MYQSLDFTQSVFVSIYVKPLIQKVQNIKARSNPNTSITMHSR